MPLPATPVQPRLRCHSGTITTMKFFSFPFEKYISCGTERVTSFATYPAKTVNPEYPRYRSRSAGTATKGCDLGDLLLVLFYSCIEFRTFYGELLNFSFESRKFAFNFCGDLRLFAGLLTSKSSRVIEKAFSIARILTRSPDASLAPERGVPILKPS